jgi:hypothetical protein
MHNVCAVRQREIYKTKLLIPPPSRLRVEIAIAKLEKYKSSGSNQIPVELIRAGEILGMIFYLK